MITVNKIIKQGLWVPAVVALSAVVLFAVYNSNTANIETIPNGAYVKNGSRVFYDFLNHVKQTNGVVILGTSETGGAMDGKNYWGLLDKDKDLNRNFYSFGGAGRCSYVYFPLILNHPEAFKNLNLLVYVNPTYWRKGLNNYSVPYYERYVSSSFANSILLDKDDSLYQKFILPGIKEESYFKAKSEIIIDDFKSNFYFDFNENYLSAGKSSKIEERKVAIENIYTAQELQEIKDRIDTTFNANFEYLEKDHSFPVIDTASMFQFDMLHTFIEICKTNNINVTFYLGPVNELYCIQRNPDLLESHHIIVRQIKEVLDGSDFPYIDGTNLGMVQGSFKDVQHISQYGAYLTALQIKQYYEKGN